ncbi:MAG: helix-turn-helix transcriptional regulator [Nocardioides sp.]|nr:helix-turn-helix transcriptional regulator [Nocardioides sp.]
MTRPDPRRAEDVVRRLCDSADDATALRVRVVEALRPVLGFRWYAWVLTDPVTTVGSAPYADVPKLDGLPGLIRAKYLTPEHRWTSLDAPVRLSALPQDAATRWRTALAPYAADVASVVHSDRHGTWAFLDLWREEGSFDDGHLDLLERTRAPLAKALRRCQARTFSELSAPPGPRDGPGVLLVDEDLHVIGDTQTAERWLSTLLPPSADRAPVPAVILNVAAQLLATEQGVDDHPARARVHLAHGRWITAWAARLHATDGSAPIAVTMEETAPLDRLEVFTRACGLSPRETTLVGLLAAGLDTRAVADRMGVSPHTVQDHLKSVFDRTGSRSRRELLSRALGVSSP